ncbi:MAG TPA: LysR family transcriptional regulator [Casimicrobiaceae bacterium]|nr:LysR family transcriptional regulator [Casimicrobiaceae bacterium]
MDLLRSSISLRQLHYLVAVADAGSFSAAAEETHVAQPALSRQIAALEARVGLRLLNRSRTGVALTDGGARLYTLARNTLERLGSVQAELRASEQRPAGPVTMALPISLASMLVPAVLRELEAHYPEIELRIDDRLSPENQHSLEAGLVDFGIVAAADELVNVEYEPLVCESLLLVEKPDTSRRVSPTITFAQVAKRKLVLPPRSFHIRRTIDDVARVAHCSLDIAYEQRSVTTIMSLVRAGLAGTITNSPSVYQFWTGEIVARCVVHPEITRTISLAWPRRRTLSVAARAAYDVVKQCALDAVKEDRWRGVPLC